MMSGKEFIIIGAGGHARVIIDTLLVSGKSVKGIIDVDYSGQEEEIMGCSVLGGLDLIEQYESSDVVLALAIGDNNKRSRYYDFFQQRGFFFPSIIHPSAIVSEFASISDGTFVNSGAVINSCTEIGANTIINTASVIDHEAVIGKNCHVCPGAKIAGRVTVGNNSFIGIGANIIDYIKIGHDVVIGAGSVVVKDVEPHSTCVGVPGRIIK